MEAECDSNGTRLDVPSHVDPALVFDFDYLKPPGIDGSGDVYRALKALHGGPDIVWTPRHGGHWVVARADDVRWVHETHELFSHTENTVPRGRTKKLMPINVDPPLHARYRAVFNPHFTPRKVEQIYQVTAREIIVELIEGLRAKGQCEFVRDFALNAPIRVFFDIVDLPFERRDEFFEWGHTFGRSLDQDERRKAFADLSAYLMQLLDERSHTPGDDIFSSIADWRNSRHFQDEDEMIGMAALVFLGGLDTVAAQMSFAAWQLALYPELQLRLRDDPEILPQAVEEMLRRHGLSNTSRLIRKDCERKGAQFREGEMVLIALGCSGIDERRYADPFRVDFDRPPVPHSTFGSGPHHCVAAPLARMELRLFLEEWSKRMPPVRLDPDQPPPLSHAGGVNGVSHLHLAWDI